MTDNDSFGAIIAEVNKLVALSTLFAQVEVIEKMDTAATNGVGEILSEIAEKISLAAREMDNNLRPTDREEADSIISKEQEKDSKTFTDRNSFNSIVNKVWFAEKRQKMDKFRKGKVRSKIRIDNIAFSKNLGKIKIVGRFKGLIKHHR